MLFLLGLEACWKTTFDILCTLPGQLLSGMVDAAAWLFFAHRGARLVVFSHLICNQIITSFAAPPKVAFYFDFLLHRHLFHLAYTFSTTFFIAVKHSYTSYFPVKSHLFWNASCVFIRQQGNFWAMNIYLWNSWGSHNGNIVSGILIGCSGSDCYLTRLVLVWRWEKEQRSHNERFLDHWKHFRNTWRGKRNEEINFT